MARIHCPAHLASGQVLALPAAAARHVQVLRMQPGQELTLFNGEGGQWRAVIQHMGRSDVLVRVIRFEDLEREAGVAVHLAIGMPANERMDWLVEKASELGAASLQPLITARAVVRLAGERAQRKREHWQAIAAAACEQCGRNRVPPVHEPLAYAHWLERVAGAAARKVVLSLSPQSTRLFDARSGDVREWICLSGPEGGLEPGEEQMALSAGFTPVSLGPRVLRAETAPLALLSAMTLA